MDRDRAPVTCVLCEEIRGDFAWPWDCFLVGVRLPVSECPWCVGAWLVHSGCGHDCGVMVSVEAARHPRAASRRSVSSAPRQPAAAATIVFSKILFGVHAAGIIDFVRTVNVCGFLWVKFGPTSG